MRRPFATHRTKAFDSSAHVWRVRRRRGIRELDITVIEDCAQAVGDRAERSIAGDIGVFSFHPTKCLTTGEGGMAVSNDSRLNTRMREIRDGRNMEITTRFISPMPDTAAALGLSQLNRYSEALQRRRQMARIYTETIEQICPESLPSCSNANTMYFRFPLKLKGCLNSYEAAFAKRGIVARRGVDRLLHRLSGIADDSLRNVSAALRLQLYLCRFTLL
jgi:dTDP-4-amino-4,6-dideoxygalactose transaminase